MAIEYILRMARNLPRHCLNVTFANVGFWGIMCMDLIKNNQIVFNCGESGRLLFY